MSISILNRGASGGLKPKLTVIAPSGSTIELLQNGVVIRTYVLGADETEYIFSVSIGTYNVRSTLVSNVQSISVVVDTVARYTVTFE